MARDTLLGFPAHTLPYRRGKFITLSTASAPTAFAVGAAYLSHPQGRSNVRVEIGRGILGNIVLPDLKMKVRTVDLPVLPTAAIGVPAFTGSPSFTSTLLHAAYSVVSPSPWSIIR